MDYREHLNRAKEEIQGFLDDEKLRHETALELENKFHDYRVNELEKLITKIDSRNPKEK